MQSVQTPVLDTTTSLEAAVKPPKAPLTDKQRAAVHKAAKDFEAVFLNEMIKPMFDGVNGDGQDKDPALGGGSEQDIYQSMLVDKVSAGIANSGGIGIAKDVEKELLKLQEAK